jgi:hypothetical protein
VAIPLAALLCLLGCSSPPGIPTASPPPQQSSSQPYLRIARPENGAIELQVAARKFVPARGNGPAVWLIGASHIGESNYYAGLQRQLDTQTLVLYEGVGQHPRAARRPKQGRLPSTLPPPAANTPAPAGPDDGLQATMARSLGLVFQLQAIRCDRTNFFNSDLSIVEIQALMRQRPAAPTQRTGQPGGDDENNAFQELLRAMDGSSAFGAVMRGVFQFIGGSTKLQAMSKLALIEVLGAMKADPSRLRGVPPDLQKLLEVLIQERNKVVIDDLRFELQTARRRDSIGIFYGAGHLPDLEQRLRSQLGYRPSSDVWHTAFSVHPAQAGLSTFELSFLQNLIRSQLAPLTD